MPLTDAKVRSAKPAPKPYKLNDGAGLHLLVRPTGSKLWRYRYRIDGRENLFAIGEYLADKRGSHVSLDDARAARDSARALVKKGIHPSHSRQTERIAARAANANTLEAVAKEWIEKKQSGWSPYYLKQVESFFAADVFPQIGKLPLRGITAAHVLDVVRKIEKRGAASVALLVRQWLSAVFRYGVATLRADVDPAAALKGAIHRPKTEHHKPLTQAQLADFVTALGKFGGFRTTAIALHLMLLTFVRTVELRAARWEEIDLEAAEWRIPAERMKMRQMHIVPLSSQAVALLKELKTLTGERELLFPNYRNSKSCMTPTTLNRALERMGFNGKDSIGFSAHGFRSTASTMLNEMGFRPDVIERQLAHAERSKVRASYNHAEYMKERQEMMQAWSDTIDRFAKREPEGNSDE